MTVIAALITAVVIVAYLGTATFALWIGIEGKHPIAAILMAVVLIALLILGIGIITPAQPREPRNLQATVDCGP